MTIYKFSEAPAHIVGGKEMFPNGPSAGGEVKSINPFSGDILWRCPSADAAIVDSAVQAARSAFPAWAKLEFGERENYLSKFVKLVQEHSQALAELIATEAGKPLWESKVEANALVTKFAASVDAYKLRVAESGREVRGLRSRTRFLPHGVMAVLGPFNFPASMANSHIMPALLAGNTVVFKPSELTPLTGIFVSRLWEQAGLPAGVMNCVTGDRVTGEYLTQHSGIDGVLFVGSHRAGLSILRQLVDTPEKIVALEMGGNSPLAVWDFDNIDATVSIIIQSAFMSGGQRCSAARRLLVRRDHDALIERLISVARKVKIGNFSQVPEPYYGPLIRKSAADAVLRRKSELIKAGAEELLAAEQRGPIGTLISPGLLDMTRCSDDQDEEIFGPVLKVYRFDELGEAVDLANRTKFGLASGIICRDRKTFEEFFRTTKAGIVNWNQQLTGATTLAPFGGVKQSGNYRPAGFLSADYCSYAIASFEVPTPRVPDPPVPGLSFDI